MPRNQNGRGGNRRSNNNNPDGRNQYNSGFIGMARERPATAAAVAAGAAAAGVFLWSKRGQISDQLNQLGDQIGEWTETLRSERELEMAGGGESFGSATGGALGGGATGDLNRGTTARNARASAGKRRSATSGGSIGSGTMSGGSLDTGPSGRGGE